MHASLAAIIECAAKLPSESRERLFDAAKTLAEEVDAMQHDAPCRIATADEGMEDAFPEMLFRLQQCSCLLRTLPEEILIVDRDLHCVYSNRQAELAPRLPEPLTEKMQQVFTTGETAAGEMEYTDGGEARCSEYTARPLHGRNEEIKAALCILHDITGQKNTEKRLKTSENRFKRIFETSPIGIAYCTARGRLLDVNPAFTSILALKQRRGSEDFNIFRAFACLEPEFDRLRSGEMLHATVPYDTGPHRSGGVNPRPATVYLNLMISPVIPAETGFIKGYLVQVQDITRQARIEEQKQRAYDQIEKNIEQFAILGDHVRHPLQVIQGLADLLDDEPASGKIARQVQRINEIVRQLDQGWVDSREIREFLRRNELYQEPSGQIRSAGSGSVR